MWKMRELCLLLIALVVFVSPFENAQKKNCLSSNEIGEIPLTIRSNLYRGQQSFTVDMLQAIQKSTPNENVFFSPYSTYHALLLAYFGARGNTEQELIQGLRLQWADSKDHVRNAYLLEKNSRELRAKKMPLEFASADKMIFDNDVKLSPCMIDIFVDALERKNFRQNPEQCRLDINGWIANVTRNEIPNMLNPGDVTSETQMVLANAAYFKGQWSSQFDPKYTTFDVFYTKPNQTSLVQMMHKRGTYNLAIDERLGAYVLDMPYLTSNERKESEISMVIILPPTQSSVEQVLTKLTPDTLDLALKESSAREIDISMPKFEFEQRLELIPILGRMGINSIFSHDADFRGFSTETPIMLGDAKHVAKIKVDEEGSTAAAATVLFSFRSARPIEPTKIECNHPFLFLIYDNVSKAVLFTGIYRDPMTQQ